MADELNSASIGWLTDSERDQVAEATPRCVYCARVGRTVIGIRGWPAGLMLLCVCGEHENATIAEVRSEGLSHLAEPP